MVSAPRSFIVVCGAGTTGGSATSSKGRTHVYSGEQTPLLISSKATLSRCHPLVAMYSEAQKPQRSLFIEIAIGIGISALFFMFRFTAAAAFLVFVLLCISLSRHHSRWTLHVVFALFVAAILIPVDVHVPGWHGPLINSKHTGLRFVQVMYGFTSGPLDGSEAILGGCVVGLYDSRWRLVWD